MTKLWILMGVLALSACNKVPDENTTMEAEAQATADQMKGEDTWQGQVSVFTDDDTKCQYLVTNGGGITRRLGDYCPAASGSGGNVEVSIGENDSEDTSE